MTEHPILFSGPMVRAILAGRKRATRRVIRPQPDPDWGFDAWAPGDGSDWRCYASDYPELAPQRWRCPYGRAGDRLWVRESYCPFYFDDGKHGYRADWTGAHVGVVPEPRWTPSIHMRRAHARILLDVVEVKVARLQDGGLDVAAVRAEGVELPDVDYAVPERPDVLDWEQLGYARSVYREVWDALNADRGFPWASNPWVWVVAFRGIP